MKKNAKNKCSVKRVLSREEEIKSRSKVFSHLSVTLLAVLFVFAISQFDFYGLRGVLVDALFRTKMRTTPSSAISLIAYDDDSSVRYEGASKIPAEEIAKVFSVLAEEKPLAVALLASVNEKTYSDSELAILSKSFEKVPNMYIGYTDDESLGKNAPTALLHTARYLPGYISRDTFSYGADSVSRRVMVSIEGVPTVYTKLAELYNNQPLIGQDRIKRYERIGDTVQTYINWQGPQGTYRPISSLSVAQGKVPQGTFTGKIVLISSILQSKKGSDHIFTPYSREHFGTSLLEGAADSLGTLIQGNGIYKASNLSNALLALLIGVLTVNMVSFLSPGRGILFVVAELAFLFLLARIILFKLGCVIDIAHPIVAACVGYYLVIPYRLVDEYRKRWHYQEKSELMAQLEQLKSNFLSLISHDLKTPIARIQGNAELALSESKKTGMSENQRHSLDAIVHTTEDLGRYVETILDLTRIESSRVPLKKTTKDINATIREVVQSKQFLANEKQITLKAELEPLFSIKYDVKLIQQVLSNLLENAIKYSPENTTITLASREDGSWVKVSVKDEGYGIAQEEQEKVFSKFYRGNSPNTQKEKGTGLGLYLVRYFVELHEGLVELNSDVGHGSEFTVSLPV